MKERKVTKTEKMDIQLMIYGIKKRCRNIEQHRFDIALHLPYEDIDLLGKYENTAKMIANQHFKVVVNARLYLTPWTQLDYEGFGHGLRDIIVNSRSNYKCLEVKI